MRCLGEDGRELDVKEMVGFSTLPDQLVNRELSRGFDFNILVVGEEGIGKATLIDSLFRTDIAKASRAKEEEGESAVAPPPPSSSPSPPAGLRLQHASLSEGGVDLRLTVIATENLGVPLDRSGSAEPALAYIDAQYESYLQAELRTHRDMSAHRDSRVHVCLYMLPPTGHSLRSLDLVMLRALQDKVSIIPVIAKADTVTQPELEAFRATLRREIKDNSLELFEARALDEAEAMDKAAARGEEEPTSFPPPPLAVPESQSPLAIVGSRDVIALGGTQSRVRQYPWGLVDVENDAHSDLPTLRRLLLRTHMQTLRTRLHSTLYERFRRARLGAMGFSDVNSSGEAVSVRETYEAKRAEHVAELGRREEAMRQVFVHKVKDKEAELKAAEKQLTAKFDELHRVQVQENGDIEAQVRRLAAERAQWLEAVKRESEAAASAGGGSSSGKKEKKKAGRSNK